MYRDRVPEVTQQSSACCETADHPESKDNLKEVKESRSGINYPLSFRHLYLKNEQQHRRKQRSIEEHIVVLFMTGIMTGREEGRKGGKKERRRERGKGKEKKKEIGSVLSATEENEWIDNFQNLVYLAKIEKQSNALGNMSKVKAPGT